MSTNTAHVTAIPLVASASKPQTPSVYTSKFKLVLTRGRWSALAILAVWAVTCFMALRSVDVATRVIGHDTSVSITAAEHLRSVLADADGNLANMLIANEGVDGPFTKDFRKDMVDASAALIDAARNITYPEEVGPVQSIQRDLSEYERLVGISQGIDVPKRAIAAGLSAANLMQSNILLSAERLDQVNFEHLKAAYDGHKDEKLWRSLVMWLMTAVALLALGALQFAHFTFARRILNPGLAAATAFVVLASLYCIFATASGNRQLDIAKSEAFDSVYALSNIQAIANEANAAESFWLLAYDDQTARRDYAEMFKTKAHQIVGIDVASAIGRTSDREIARLAGKDGSTISRIGQFPGLLGDELDNIVFPGELAGATDTLKAWGGYLAIDVKLRSLQETGHKLEAVTLDVGRNPGQSNWAFDRFDEALQRTIKINQDAFDAAIARSESLINLGSYLIIALIWALTSAGVWFGIGQRLREYDF